MSDPVASKSETAKPRVVRKRRSWLRVVVSRVVAVLAGLAAMACLGLYVLMGQTLRVPDWLRGQIETRIESNLGGLQLGFGDMRIVLRDGGRPRVALRDVDLSGPNGQVIASLRDAEASLALRPLLRGQVQPKRITLQGALATVRRDRNGQLSLFFGQQQAQMGTAMSPADMVQMINSVLEQPNLEAFVGGDLAALTLRYEDVRQGRAWTLDGGSLRLTREGGDLRISGGFSVLSGADYASFVEVNYASQIGGQAAEFGVSVRDVDARDLAGHALALGWLEVVRAPISGALRGAMRADGTLGSLSATLQMAAGAIQPTDGSRPIPFDAARSYFSFAPDTQMLTLDELSVTSPWGQGVADGRVHLGAKPDGTLGDLTGQIALSGLSVNPDGFYDTPLQIASGLADFQLKLNPFRLRLGQVHAVVDDSNVHLSGTLGADRDGWSLDLDAAIDTMLPAQLLALWPDSFAKGARKWLARNLSGGRLMGLELALRTRPDTRANIHASFDYDNAEVRFLRTMPPIRNAAGHASLVDGRFVTTATSGQVSAEQGGVVNVAGTSFIIPDVSVKKGAPGIVRLIGQGPVTAVISLLNRPPLRILKDTPLPVDLADGEAQVTGTVALPLRAKVGLDEIDFHLSGEVRNVKSTALVPGFTLTTPRLQLSGDQTQIILSGAGQIADLPARVRWRQPLGKGVPKSSTVEGEIELSPRAIDTFNIGLPPGTVSGTGKAQFTLALAPGAPPQLNLQSDLAGVGLRLAPLGWSKARSATGALRMSGTIGPTTTLDQLSLRAPGLSASGRVTTRPGGGLERATFSSVRLGGWLDARVELVGRGNAAPEVRLLGGRLDMRAADFASGPGSGAGSSGSMRVALERLQITDSIALTDFRGDFTTNGGLGGLFQGKVNGQTQVNGRVVPQNGRSAFQISSKDAGGVFRAAGVLSQGRGGDFGLTLVPVQQPGQFDGVLRVTNTRVKDGRAFAALLNSISLVGLIDEMAGQGIQFSEVDARFRLAPSRLTLLSGSAIGPSIGVSMDGTYDVKTGRLNMQGVLSPVYLFNAIGAVLTRKGEGLVGFSYRLTGAAQDPKVSVNPLSALTPGLLREVFRAPTPTVDGVPATRRPDPPRTGAAEGR
ncbi:MAG: AsmA-like C-terminal region-containing protein [Sedimentitalea sp.]